MAEPAAADVPPKPDGEGAAAAAETEADAAEDAPPVRKKDKYRKPKPWDHDGIEHWKIEEFTSDSVAGRCVVAETTFSTLFPKYREQYLRQWWPQVTSELKRVQLSCELDLIEGSMTVSTTRKTWDPYIIMKARDLIKLLARSVPFQQAIRILQDDVAADVIKIGNLVRNKERFIKRRQRLIGPNGATLKAIELLTECYVMVQGNTVSAMGPFNGLKQLRRIVIDCMNNIHPVYSIKALMIKRELSKNETLKEESWDRFLPKFKKKNVKTKAKKIVKKERALFPPAQTPSKVDLQIESGEYFLRQEQRISADKDRKKSKSMEVSAVRRQEREKLFVPPKEDASGAAAPASQDAAAGIAIDITALKKKLSRPEKRKSAGSANDFVLGDSAKKAKKAKKDKKARKESLL